MKSYRHQLEWRSGDAGGTRLDEQERSERGPLDAVSGGTSDAHPETNP